MEITARAARCLIAVCAPVVALFVAIQPVLAQDTSDEQERLHAQMLRHPTNYVVTFAYVKVATGPIAATTKPQSQRLSVCSTTIPIWRM